MNLLEEEAYKDWRILVHFIHQILLHLLYQELDDLDI